MTNLISRTVAYVNSLFKGLQLQRFLAVALVGFLLLTTNVDPGRNTQSLDRHTDKLAHQTNSDRPKTTGEWNREARETQGEPGDRLGTIAKESAEAVKDFAKLYPDTARRSAEGFQDNQAH